MRSRHARHLLPILALLGFVGAALWRTAPVAAQAPVTTTAVAVGGIGTATLTFNARPQICRTGAQLIVVCVDATTGLPIITNNGSILNGSVVFTIANTAIARFESQLQTTDGGTTPTTAVVSSPSQATLRCQSLAPIITAPDVAGVGSLPRYFGGCGSVAVRYRAIAPGSTTITAQFFPDLPGAASGAGVIIAGAGAAPITFALTALQSVSAEIQVLPAPVSTAVSLVRGCNNVSPLISESIAAFIARAQGTTVLSIFEYQAATNSFRAAPGPGAPADAPSDLAQVTALRPVFLCVTGPALLQNPTL